MSKKKKCDGETDVYSRVTGFYGRVQNFNPGKEAEYGDRTPYVIDVKKEIKGTVKS